MKHGKRNILITGVSGRWGGLVARRLLAESGVHVLGIDRRTPEHAMAGLDFVRADVRNPLLGELMAAEGVDAVVHLAFRECQWRREEDFNGNVLGTMQLVGSCAEAGVRQVVLRSTMAVYGALPSHPMYLPEDWPLSHQGVYAYVRDAVEIEDFVHGFSVEYPEMAIAILRFAHVLGPEMSSPLARLLNLPAAPVLLGFDPLLQVVDAVDAVEGLARAALGDMQGPVNVAAQGVLPLTAITGMAGRPPLPIMHWWAYWGRALAASVPAMRRALAWLPMEPDHLRYACTGELQRMASDLGLTPRYAATAAVERYAEFLRSRPFRAGADRDRCTADGPGEDAWRRASWSGSPDRAPSRAAWLGWEGDHG
ncbi:MAG: NAD-dependent epimerase/dehydratase family protein [Anaerolineae bacterium]